MKKKFILLTIVLAIACSVAIRNGMVTIRAQSLPVTRTLAWDANAASDNVINYTVTLDSVGIGNPTGTTQSVVFTTIGVHTLTVTATNSFGTSLPATLSVNVIIPGRPANPRLQ